MGMILRTADGCKLPACSELRRNSRDRLVRKAPYVSGQYLNLRFSQLAGLGWHLVDLALVDHGDNGLLTPAMQPDVVGQVGRAQRLVALAVHAVAGGASGKF